MHTLYRSWLLASLVAAVLLWPARLDARTASPAAAFTSVKSGAWSDPATWGGTSIPGVEDAVTIAAGHTVDITQGAKAGALTIAAGATIRRVSGADGVYVLEVEGAVVNRGTILWCHPVDFGYDRLALRVAGDVTNEGVWDADYTALDGTSTQRIVQAGAGLTNGLSRFWYDETPTSGLTAGSDLRFTGRLELRGATLDAGANQLILTGSEALDGGRTNGTGGVVRFAGGTLRSGPNFVLSNLRFEGPTTFAGSVQVGPNVSVVGALTVADSLRRMSGSDGVYVLEVEGSVTNQGTIFWCHPVDFGYDRLALRITGDVRNEGVWDADYTALNGSTAQRITLAGTGLTSGLGRLWYDEMPASGLTAGSDLRFTGRLELRGATLDAGANRLVVYQNLDVGLTGNAPGLPNGTVRFSTGGTVQAIPNSSADVNMVFANVTFEGPTTFTGHFNVGQNVVVRGPLAIAPGTILQRAGGSDGDWPLVVEGNVVNDGTIRWCNPRDFGYDKLVMRVSGSITNRGRWEAHQTYLTGTAAHTVRSDSVLHRTWYVADPGSEVVAGGPLYFSGPLRLGKGTLRMGAHTLTLDYGNDTSVDGGRIIFDGGTLRIVGNGGPLALANVRIDGGVTLVGKYDVGTNVTFGGNVTIPSGTVLQRASGGDGIWPMAVEGSLTNHGEVRPYNMDRDVGYDKLAIHLGGTLTNHGSYAPSYTRLVGARGHDVIAHRPIQNELSLERPATLVGHVVLRQALGSGVQTRDYLVARLTSSGSGLDSLVLDAYGNQPPANFGNAVRRTWTLRPVPALARVSLASLTLLYNDDVLGSAREDSLQVYHSADNGQTWTRVSTSANLTRDLNGNAVTLTSAPAYGTYVLSSRADAIPAGPNVVVSVTGPERIRVGPPNRYQLTYANVGSAPVEDFLLSVRTTDGIYIDHVLGSPGPDGQARRINPVDFSRAGDNTYATFWVRGLNPGEERVMTAVLKTTADIQGRASDGTWEPVNATMKPVPAVAVGVALALGGALTTDLATGILAGQLANVPQTPAEANQVVIDAVKKVGEDWLGSPEKGMSMASDELMGKLGAKVGNPIARAADLANAAGDIADGVRSGQERMGRYNALPPANLPRGRQPLAFPDPAPVTPSPVRSWDPNEKNGPVGVGTEGFVTSLGRVAYQIKFENKKEATAAAY
ncbi:MAG TPA: hypothetical protein VD948_01375, partial [Rhodothermales bacterium]|nr:hypothetical protein [Rhodothermales bacterium]